jgi:hypothetical protein
MHELSFGAPGEERSGASQISYNIGSRNPFFSAWRQAGEKNKDQETEVAPEIRTVG